MSNVHYHEQTEVDMMAHHPKMSRTMLSSPASSVPARKKRTYGLAKVRSSFLSSQDSLVHGLAVSARAFPVTVPHAVVTVGAQAELPLAPEGHVLTVVVVQVVEPAPPAVGQAVPEVTHVCPAVALVQQAGVPVRVQVDAVTWLVGQAVPEVTQLCAAVALAPQAGVPVSVHVEVAPWLVGQAVPEVVQVAVVIQAAPQSVPVRTHEEAPASRGRKIMRIGVGVGVGRGVVVNLAAHASSSTTRQTAIEKGRKRMVLAGNKWNQPDVCRAG